MCRKLFYLFSFGLVLCVAAGVANAHLVAYWPMDEGTGTIVGDATGIWDGTITGNVTWVDGKEGAALEFPGGQNYVNCGNVEIGPDLTLAYWCFNPEKAFERSIGQHSGNYTTDPGWCVYSRDEGEGTVWFRVHGADDAWNGGDIIIPDILPKTEWYHLAFTFDGATRELKGYLNGEMKVSKICEAGRSIYPNTNDLRMGHVGTGEPFAGMFDEVAVWNHVLTEEEILAVMEGHMGGANPYAFRPEPADGVLLEATWANISWKPGAFAVSHDVYFGENFDDVNTGAEGVFMGNQAVTNIIVGFPGFPYPDGLVPGTTYYWRIDEVNDTDPNSPWKGDVWSFTVPPRTAYDPEPADGAKFVFTDVELSWTAGFGAKLHTVYFGDNFDDVNNAVVGLPQSETTYTPGTLELEKTYYWRVDEFDGAATHKGDVWSFKTLPDIPITNPNLIGWWTLDEGMGNTAVDWSGHGNHGTLFGPEWAVPGLLGDAALKMNGGYVAIQNLSYNDPNGTEVTVCAWIRTNIASNQYIASFDRDSYWRLEINGSGAGDGQVGWDVMTSSGQVDYGSVTRVDDWLWHHVTGVFDNGKLTIYIDAQPEPSVSGGPTFGSGEMRSGFIGGNSEAGGYNGGPPVQYIDELRIYDKALTQEEIEVAMRGDLLLAWNPKPSQGSKIYIRDATPLSWSAGDNASQHDVYFGTDSGTVADADASDTTGIYRGRQGVTIYTPPEVEWGGGPYYWRVDEYNSDATISKGNVWSFTVADFIGIDDIEDYNDYPPDEIFSTWIDGWEVPTNGSLAGHADPPFAETGNVHGGSQSMPVYYENNFKYSEITMTLVYPRDWTEEGVGVLSLWFCGDATNAAERMYVNLNGIATVYHNDPSAALIDTWTEWRIDLQEFAAKGVNLANVNTISIGFGDKNNLQAGGSGMVLFDDIRLYRPAPEPALEAP